MYMTNTLDIPDRRKAPRFQVALPVELPEGTGITRNLSTCGVFFETDRVFVVEEVIQFALVLEHIDPSRPVRLQCRGQVVRVEQCGDIMGVAVVIKAYRLDA
jgi:PilZ domain